MACSEHRDKNAADILAHRPGGVHHVYDDMGLMTDVRESTVRYLENIRDRYGLDVMIVALPALPESMNVNSAAADIFSNWKIGQDVGGRGLLVLFVDDVKEVKVEVGFDLEDVFTDLFTGYIEDRQLPHYYHAGDLPTGLTALLEEIEARAQIKYKGGYSALDMSQRDARFLSQGAGAREVLGEAAEPAISSATVNTDYPAGQTPDEAWQTMLRAWKNKVKDPYLGVYTAVARLAYRDYANVSDAYVEFIPMMFLYLELIHMVFQAAR